MREIVDYHELQAITEGLKKENPDPEILTEAQNLLKVGVLESDENYAIIVTQMKKLVQELIKNKKITK